VSSSKMDASQPCTHPYISISTQDDSDKVHSPLYSCIERIKCYISTPSVLKKLTFRTRFGSNIENINHQ
jgi:hypothetical protein